MHFSLCGANSELQSITADGQSLYGVYYSFNTADYDAYNFTVNNISNSILSAVVPSADSCGADVTSLFGCTDFTTLCGGPEVTLIDSTEANTDVLFLVWTTDAAGCGEFDFTLNAYYIGCTDAAATNYDADATYDSGLCDYEGVTPANDYCGGGLFGVWIHHFRIHRWVIEWGCPNGTFRLPCISWGRCLVHFCR